VDIFALFDGHCGPLASLFCKDNLGSFIDNVQNYDNLPDITEQIMRADARFLNESECEDGTTAIFSIVQIVENDNALEYKITVGNIGDSRVVLGNNSGEAIKLTEDHKPNTPTEQQRIESAGGHVSVNRVRGSLALSRAIGDRAYKVPLDFPPDRQQVICIPDYEVITGKSGDWLFLACDGIYEGDFFTRETVIKWISDKLETTNDTALIMADLLDECLFRGSKDNMSAMLVQFTDGRDYNQPDEYIPGPYYEGAKHAKFQQAYRNFAELNGLTFEESIALFKKRNGNSGN